MPSKHIVFLFSTIKITNNQKATFFLPCDWSIERTTHNVQKSQGLNCRTHHNFLTLYCLYAGELSLLNLS